MRPPTDGVDGPLTASQCQNGGVVGVAGAFVGYHIAMLLALGGGLVTVVIAAVAGAAVVLFAWWLAK